MSDNLATALEMTSLIERVHGGNHPELTRVRELTHQIAQDDDAATAALFAELRSVTSNYTVPGDGCEAYQAAFGSLKALDASLATPPAQASRGSSSQSISPLG